MSEKKAKPKRSTRPSTINDDLGFPISTRLSEVQRKYVEEAAALKGWTPANFMRQAAYEKAIHVLNTSRPNSFAFARYASHVAKQLYDPTSWLHDGEGGEVEILNLVEHYPDLDGIGTGSSRLSARDLDDLREALQLGGAEFLRLVLEECARFVKQDATAALPAPIRPE